MERLHLDTGAVDGVDVHLDRHEVVTDLEVDRHRTDEERMAQGDHVGGALGGLDSGHSSDGEHVALLDLAVGDRSRGLRLHEDLALRDGASVGWFFRGDIDHAGSAERIEVGEGEITHVAQHVSPAFRLTARPGTVAVMSDAQPPTAPLPFDAIAHLRTDAVRFTETVTDHGLHHEVPSCPGWNLGDLAWHMGEVWNFWGRVVAEQVTSVDVLRTWPDQPRPSDDLLIDWVTAAHTSLFSALARARHDQEVWTWTGANRDARWVERRMTHETTVHRWDAANAVSVPYDIPVAVAADGIDEYLTFFAGRGADEHAEPVGGSVHLHCTDTGAHDAEGADDRAAVGGEWLVGHLDAWGATFTREHAKGDAAIRGTAEDLLLWLWRRDAGPVEILGDTGVAERFRAFSPLT